MSKVKVEHIPTVKYESMLTLSNMSVLIRRQLEWDRIKITDRKLYVPNFDGWVKIINYLKQRVPTYLVDKFDCENFAGWFRHEVARLWQINTMAEVEGWMLKGSAWWRHGWNAFYDGTDFYQLESQTGVIMDMDDPEYKPDEIVMG